MEAMLSEYFPILVFLAIAIALSLAFIGAAVLIAKQNPDQEKTSAYECGFEAIDSTRRQFDVRRVRRHLGSARCGGMRHVQ